MDIILDEDDKSAAPENIDGILTFDEILEDAYYKAEFEKRVQQRLEEYSHSDVKGGTENMEITEEVQKPEEGEVITKQETEGAAHQPTEGTPAPAGDPAAENTDASKAKDDEATPPEPAREMSAEQYALYNETLRRVSKTAHGSIEGRYNAFEDADVKALVKKQVMEGTTPNVTEIVAGVVARHTPAPAPEPAPQPENGTKTAENPDAALTALRVENALLKAGVIPERVDAATRLFIADGGDLGKIAEFVAKYPEWHKQEGDVVFSQAPPASGRTAPTAAPRQYLNDFERRVAEVRKRAGLDY